MSMMNDISKTDPEIYGLLKKELIGNKLGPR